MPNSQTIKGQCLCGAVQVQVQQADNSIGVCHCSQCRQWTSSPMQTIDCGDSPDFKGEEHIGVYNSSDWAERGFCKQCGSALFYRLKQSGQHFMAAGLFGDLKGFTFDHEVFIDEKPEFYSFANDTRKMTSSEVFAFFTSQAD